MIQAAAELGYLSTCSAAPSACTFAATSLDAPGPANDLLDFLACRITESLSGAGVQLFANKPIQNECHRTIGSRGLGFLKKELRMLKVCQVHKSASTAACLAGPANAARRDRLLADWRSASVAACATIDPVESSPSYPTYCSGQTPAILPSCGPTAPPCTFPATTQVDSAAQGNDDLLDCASCRTEEAVLAVARDLYGANLCCVGDDCGVVRTRRACLRAGGAPAYYRATTVAEPMYSPHALAIDRDGMVYVADTGHQRIKKITPQGQASLFAALDFPPYDVSVDGASGAVYVAARCSHQLLRVAPGGAISTVAGTGLAGHGGDGGPAIAARTAAPNKSTVDEDGNVYFTESGFVSLLCANSGLGTERIRKVAPDGTIGTVAGNAIFAGDGIGGPALDASLAIPTSVESGPGGVLVIGESGLNRVLRIEPDQTLTHVAGLPITIIGAYSGDGGPATGPGSTPRAASRRARTDGSTSPTCSATGSASSTARAASSASPATA